MAGPTFVLMVIGTPQTGRLLNGAFGPSRIFSGIARMLAALTLRGTGMSLMGLSRHLPPPQRLIPPSGQTLTHSSTHLSCPNQDFRACGWCLLLRKLAWSFY